MGKCSKIRHIVQLRQMLRRWRARAAFSRSAPADVPAGHVAVCVGSSGRRFVVRAAHLNHPVFRKLLAQAAEEYGFAHAGPLTVPCDESAFEEILRHISSSSSSSRCHAGGLRSPWHAESLPLLLGIVEKSVRRRLASVLLNLKVAEHLKETLPYIEQRALGAGYGHRSGVPRDKERRGFRYLGSILRRSRES